MLVSFFALLSLMSNLPESNPKLSVPSADSHPIASPQLPTDPRPLAAYRQTENVHPLVQKYIPKRMAAAHSIPKTITEGAAEAMPTGYLITEKKQTEPKGHILIVRGIFTVFSLGMDDLGKKLKELGYQVKVTPSATSYREADILCEQILGSKTASPLIIIGHSLGGDLAPKLAKSFAARNVDVDMLIMLDSTMPSAPPQNVKRCVNLYQSNASPSWARVFRGTDIEAQSTKTEMFNVDIRKLAGQNQTADINHFNIDANPWIHELIVEAVDLSHEPVQQATEATTSSTPE